MTSSGPIEGAYLRARQFLARLRDYAVPYSRRVLRFFALPYCYFAQIDWDQCTASRLRVAADLLYIFFRLKYYPDNYSKCRLWTVERRSWHLYYGSMYDPYQRRQLQREVQPPEYKVVFADKEICHHLCSSLGLPVPKLLGCVEPGDNYQSMIRDALERCADRELVVKPVRGAGGRGVIVVALQHGNATAVVDSHRVPLAAVRITQRSILQERVQQHEGMASIYRPSVNTIRIQTLLTRGREAIVLGALARFGRSMSRVDNLSSGGIGVGVDFAKGELMRVGLDFASRQYQSHPESGVKFEGFAVPLWRQAVQLVQRAQAHFSSYRLLGFDVAIAASGPIIIEINPEPDNVMVEECWGPILASSKTLLEFARYGLLINQPTKALAAKLRQKTRGVDARLQDRQAV